MRIAVYGGSFNPPHRAHAMVTQWILASREADAVWLMPVYRHAFEGVHNKTLAPFPDRIRWCEAMARGIGSAVKVSAVESGLPTPSYSIDTLDHLSAEQPEHSFRLVIGADILGQVDGWKDWSRILQDYTPIVVGREGYESPVGMPCFPNVSSTEIRSRLSRGESVSDMVAAEVWDLLQRDNPWKP